MKSKFKKLLATALVLCLVLALLPAAAFADGKHTVTVQNNAGQVPANGTVTLQTNEGTPYTVSTGHNSFEADANATITVSVQPNSEDYELDYIKFNGTELTVTNNTATFTMPDNDVTLEVVFQHVWSITTDDIQKDVYKRQKFTQNEELGRLLLATGKSELIEGNSWNDTFWGVNLKTGEGRNELGKALMKVRAELAARQV